MKPGFVITSAINTKFGVYTTEQRMQQTEYTITSIRRHCPDAHITLLEMSGLTLRADQKERLSKTVNIIFDFTTNPEVQAIYQDDNWDIVKNLTEITCMTYFLSVAQENELYKNIDRFIKVSGRYALNDNFDINKFYTPENLDKCIFAKRKSSQFTALTTGGVREQYMSRCWSFPANRLDKVFQIFGEMRTTMLDVTSRGGYVDIEHMLFLYADINHVVEFDKIGVQGLLGPNGVAVED